MFLIHPCLDITSSLCHILIFPAQVKQKKLFFSDLLIIPTFRKKKQLKRAEINALHYRVSRVMMKHRNLHMLIPISQFETFTSVQVKLSNKISQFETFTSVQVKLSDLTLGSR